MDNDPKTKQQWIDFEKALKKNQEYDKYYTLIKKGTYTPVALAKKQFADNNTQISFQYVFKPYSAVLDSAVELSESEIEDYYEEHTEEYDQEASRAIAYAYFPVEPKNSEKAR